MEKISEVIKNALVAADEAIRQAEKSVMWRQKDFKELVTNCDIASENAIIKILTEAYPNSTVFSEEVGKITGEEELVWILDPIDGTHNFIHKLPQYAISIAAFRKGQPYAGGVMIPSTGEVYMAVKNQGAVVNGHKLRVSETDKLSNSMICYDNQFHKHPDMLKNLEKLQQACFTIRIFGSAVVDICSVAKGNTEARVFHKTKIVDVAAGAVLIQEAGGIITDFQGNPINAESTSIVVSNGKIQEQLLQLLSKGGT